MTTLNHTTEITLSAEQKAVFEIMEGTSQHLFITGRAGTGKSVLLRHFRENTKKRVVVAAPTGRACVECARSNYPFTFQASSTAPQERQSI